MWWQTPARKSPQNVIDCARIHNTVRLFSESGSSGGSRGAMGVRGPPCPPRFFLIMRFSGNFKGKTLFWANFELRAPPWGQNSVGPPSPKSWIRARDPPKSLVGLSVKLVRIVFKGPLSVKLHLVGFFVLYLFFSIAFATSANLTSDIILSEVLQQNKRSFLFLGGWVE